MMLTIGPPNLMAALSGLTVNQITDLPATIMTCNAFLKLGQHMRLNYLQRREFVALLGGAAATFTLRPDALSAQQREPHRIGVLMGLSADDPESQARLAAFAQGLQQLGWTVGQNLRIDYRWGAGNADTMRKYATELVALAPEVILAHSSAAVAPLLQASRTVPVVFALVADPVGAGFVESLARPGGNVTGITNFEYAMSGKWLELLKEVAPDVKRAAVLRESAIATGPGQFGAIQAVAPALGIDVYPIDVRDASEIERDITAFARASNGGLIVTGSPAATVHRNLIITLAARHRLPAVYNSGFYASSGGLLSYGPNFVDPFRRAAGYVDRILKGEKPADLPVQAPTKYELVVNLKTAMALGLELPATVLARADEVIE
jgi:putative tryptophan/tyrosine transport system substrate-binding protein